ncbi:MAG: FAD:protein FMN transferase [Lachnospiraceae bacterium]|nr:FAD:protein FMN transferase [Lachnospiraceae bacterium]
MKYLKHKTTAFCLACILLLFALLSSGCSKRTEPISKSGFYFNTIIKITLYDSAYESLLEDCFSLADTYEGYFSATLEDSDISKINQAKGAPVEVHEETIELLEKGLYYSKLSDGGFDITIGALSSLWNFSENEGEIPKKADIQQALSTVDYHNIIINKNTVALKNPNTRIDLGAIAKGYIADKMKEFLNENGVTEGIINLGGNVLCVGAKANGDTYHIGIQKPFDETGTPLLSVQVTDETVVSSGVYERYFKVQDMLYHHILNPSTGYPYENEIYGITIICKDSVDGDGLSTTCFALGLEDGMALIEGLPDTEAIFITSDGEIHLSSGMGTDILYQEY